jgi:hypothetical protein
MAAIEKYREEVWSAYNGDDKDETLFKREKSYKEKQKMMRQERKKFKRKESKSKEHELLTDKSTKLLMQMQEELDSLRGHQEETEKQRGWLEDLKEEKKNESHGDSYVEYLLNKKREEEKPKSDVMERIRTKRCDGHFDGAGEGPNNSIVRKQSSRSPHKECRPFISCEAAKL